MAAINFTVDEENVLSAIFSHEINSLNVVGEIPTSKSVQDQVNKRVGELNLISQALECIKTFKNTQHLSLKLSHDLKNLRQAPEFEQRMQHYVNEYHPFGFNLQEIEILVFVSMTKKNKPHRSAPPLPSIGRATISRPIVPPPPPPPSQMSTVPVPVARLAAATLGAIPRRRSTPPPKPARNEQIRGEQ